LKLDLLDEADKNTLLKSKSKGFGFNIKYLVVSFLQNKNPIDKIALKKIKIINT